MGLLWAARRDSNCSCRNLCHNSRRPLSSVWRGWVVQEVKEVEEVEEVEEVVKEVEEVEEVHLELEVPPGDPGGARGVLVPRVAVDPQAAPHPGRPAGLGWVEATCPSSPPPHPPGPPSPPPPPCTMGWRGGWGGTQSREQRE